MAPNFSGTWSIDHHESFEPLMELLQIPADRRPPFPITQLTVAIAQEGENFSITSTTSQNSSEYSFVVGTTFETHLIGWMPKMKVSSSWDGNRLVFDNEHGFRLVRELVGDQMVTTIGKDHVDVRVFFNKS